MRAHNAYPRETGGETARRLLGDPPSPAEQKHAESFSRRMAKQELPDFDPRDALCNTEAGKQHHADSIWEEQVGLLQCFAPPGVGSCRQKNFDIRREEQKGTRGGKMQSFCQMLFYIPPTFSADRKAADENRVAVSLGGLWGAYIRCFFQKYHDLLLTISLFSIIIFYICFKFIGRASETVFFSTVWEIFFRSMHRAEITME